MSKTTIRQSLALLAAAVLGMAASLPAFSADPLKVGFVYVSPIGDAGWTYQHDLGRKAMEEALGDKVETKYIEDVPEGGEAERVIRRFASDGFDLVFTTSFGYMNPTIKVAKQFPDVIFEHATGYKTAENVGNYVARFYESRYLTGLVAGHMTESNTAGYVAAFPIPEVLRGINAFTLGMRSVNPDAEVKVVWVNSWFDPGREREAADVLLSQGADVVTQHTDSTAVVQAAEESGKWSVGYHSDMSKYGPERQLTAATHHWGDYYTETARQVLNGTWESTSVWGGLAEGMAGIAPLNDEVPAEVAEQVEKVKAAIIDGSVHPFQGPIKNQAGEVAVPEGETLTDDELLTMEWYVEGVQGKLPE